MKKGIFKIIVGLLFWMVAVNVNALTVKPTGVTEIAPGESKNITIVVEGASETTKVLSIEGKLTFDSNIFTLGTVTKSISWGQVSGMTNFKVAGTLAEDAISTSPVTLYTVQLTAKAGATAGNTEVKIEDVVCEDDGESAIAGATGGTLTIKVKSTDNNLSALSVSGATINFSPNTTTYNVTIDAATTTISATPNHSGATVSGTGTKNLNYGNNKFDIVVTSETGAKKTYTINVTRNDNRSNNNNLKSLTLSSGSIEFDPSTTTYEVDVKKEITKLKITAELADNKATFEPNFGPREVNLDNGLNTILIKVKSEKGEVKTYTLKVNKEDSRSSVNTLSSLILSSGKIIFKPDEFEYTTMVLYDVTDIEVNYVPTDSKAKVEVTGNKNLIVGENTIVIKVTAENETTKEYKIVVTRLAEGETLPSDNTYLKQITIDNYTINFNKNTLKYDLKIKNEKALVITALPEDSTSKVKITGNENLTDGSIINITVTSEDGSTRVYQIKIEKEKAAINPIIIYAAIGGVLLVILVVLVILIIKKKGKKQKEELVYTSETGEPIVHNQDLSNYIADYMAKNADEINKGKDDEII